MKCKVCDQDNRSIFEAKIIYKYNIKYYYCGKCNFLQTEEPYWLDEVYSDAISKFDTGHIKRNISISKKLTILFILFFNGRKKFVDYAGGNGILVRIMRDIGFDYMWDDKYAQNLFSSGFEYLQSGEIEAVTAIECFEHFSDPMMEIEKMLLISTNLVFTTELLPVKLFQIQMIGGTTHWKEGGTSPFIRRRHLDILQNTLNCIIHMWVTCISLQKIRILQALN
jgi:hypothetical protein